MNRRAKAWLVLLLIIGALVAAGIGLIKYLGSRQELTVNYNNATNVVVREADTEEDPEQQETKATTVAQSGETISLPKGLYIVTYKGSEGYADGEVSVRLGDTKQTATIDPTYSQSKLVSMLDAELGAIKSVLASKYPNISLYSIEKGKLYGRGEWYGTKLVYQGTDIYNADTLRVVMHKEGEQWKVATDPPGISLSGLLYPDVPREILADVNNFL